MTPKRLFLALLQPLLALLLIAGAAQAEPYLNADDRDWSIASAAGTAQSWDDSTSKPALTVTLAPNRDDDDHGPGYLLAAPDNVLIIDQARLIENSRVSYPTAPPSHRPCAAPPTGPPFV